MLIRVVAECNLSLLSQFLLHCVQDSALVPGKGEFGQMINYFRGAELEVWEEMLW